LIKNHFKFAIKNEKYRVLHIIDKISILYIGAYETKHIKFFNNYYTITTLK